MLNTERPSLENTGKTTTTMMTTSTNDDAHTRGSGEGGGSVEATAAGGRPAHLLPNLLGTPTRVMMVVLAVMIGALAVFRAVIESRRQGGASGVPIVSADVSAASSHAPAVLGQAPSFELIERSGRAVHSDELRGHVWIADFIFTRCLGPCPTMTANMARLQGMIADAPNIRLVSFTVDPEYDRPDVLREYAAKFGADATRWLFLTGTIEQMDAVQSKGFKLGVPGDAIQHSTRFILVDAEGGIRAYVDADDFGAMERLAAQAIELSRSGGR